MDGWGKRDFIQIAFDCYAIFEWAFGLAPDYAAIARSASAACA